jgi:hypothetical protein
MSILGSPEAHTDGLSMTTEENLLRALKPGSWEILIQLKRGSNIGNQPCDLNTLNRLRWFLKKVAIKDGHIGHEACYCRWVTSLSSSIADLSGMMLPSPQWR